MKVESTSFSWEGGLQCPLAIACLGLCRAAEGLGRRPAITGVVAHGLPNRPPALWEETERGRGEELARGGRQGVRIAAKATS